MSSTANPTILASLTTPVALPAGRPLLAVIAIATAAVPIAAGATGLRIDYAAWLGMTWGVLPFTPALAAMIWLRWDRGSAALFQLLAGLWLAIPILLLSYAAMRLALPMSDARLAAMDAALGIDVRTVIAAAGGHAWLSWLLGIAYASFSFQVLLLGPVLVLLGQRDRSERLLVSFVTTTLLCITISAAFPSVGTFAALRLDAATTGAIDPFFGHHFLASFHAVRDDPAFLLVPGVASGIVTFPSIHASTALLCSWAAWQNRLLRWPLVALNVLMFASAITHGAHYAVDTLAGAAVAAGVILLVRPVSRPRAALAGAGGAR